MESAPSTVHVATVHDGPRGFKENTQKEHDCQLGCQSCLLLGWRFSAVAAEIRPRDAASSAGAVTTMKLPFLPVQLVCLVYSKAEPLQKVPRVLLTFFLIHFCVARTKEGPRCLHVRLQWLQPVCPLTFKPKGRSGLGGLPLALECTRGWL